jgi:AAA ATPase domain
MAVAGVQLVGREDELEALVDLLETPERLPRTAALCGEAGIGKTTLWLEATRRAEALGYYVAATRPPETEARFSFAGLADLVGGLLGEVGPELAAPRRRALETALAMTDDGGASVDEGVVAFAFLEVLRTLAAEHRTLLAVDDVQWLDAPSLALLRFALRRLETAPVITLLTVRGEAPTWLRRRRSNGLAASSDSRSRCVLLSNSLARPTDSTVRAVRPLAVGQMRARAVRAHWPASP